MDDVTSSPTDPRSCPCAATVAQLRADLDALRAEIAEEVRTRRVTVVAPDGFPRVRLTADAGEGHVQVHARTASPEPDSTLVDLFALDAEADDPGDPGDPGDHPYVGLELIDRGTTVAGAAVYESHCPKPWWTHSLDDPDR